MSIVTDLTPTQYRPISLFVEIKPDETLTVDSLIFHTDIRILNAAGKQLGDDHPTPQASAAQKTAFLNWVLSNLETYETTTGLARYIKGENEL